MRFRCALLTVFLLATNALASITVSTPKTGAKVTSPVNYVATATAASTCKKGISAIAIYVDGTRVYDVDASKINTEVTMSTGSHHTVVEEWDGCGNTSKVDIDL